MLVAFAWSMFLILVMRVPEREAIRNSVILLVCAMGLSTLWYMLTAEDWIPAPQPLDFQKRTIVSWVAAVGGWFALIFISRLRILEVPKTLEQLAALPVPELSHRLPELSVALSKNEEISPITLTTIKSKLASVPTNSPDFWPVASALISKTSIAQVGIHGGLSIQRELPHSTNRVIHNTFKNMIVVLDGVNFESNVFDRCLIKYYGGQTTVNNCLFVNCLFQIRILIQPPASGAELTRTLLAAMDMRSVQLD